MTDRTRRAFLALGVGVVGAVTGCVGDERPGQGTSTDGPPDTSVTETTGRRTSPHRLPGTARMSFDGAKRLRRLDAGFPQRDVGSYYLGLLRTAAHAAAFPTGRFGDADAAAFVDDTDYSRAVLAILHDRRSSSTPDLELRGTRRDGRTLALEARYPGEGATADVTTDTLLVRVPTDGDPFRAATATIRPQFGDPVRFSTENAYDVVPAFDPAGDLVLRNRDCATIRLNVTATYEGDLFLRERTELAPASTRRLGGVVAYPGEWTVAVRASDEASERSWSLTDGPPGDVLIDVAGDGTVSQSHRPAGADRASLDACETDGFPYESSVPSENLDRPVDLWVVDRSDAAHHLSVTVRENDATVFGGDFETRAGYDKRERAGLLAKRATYDVEVTTATGRTVTESVTVREGVTKLVVLVEADGTVTVSSG